MKNYLKTFVETCDGDLKELTLAAEVMFNLPIIELLDDHTMSYVDNYLKTKVIPHKIAVYRAGISLLEDYNLADELGIDKTQFVKNLIIHDLSKFSAEELYGYAMYNFKTKEGKEEFEKSWHHHKMFNPHHPEHWLNPDKEGNLEPLPMPNIYLLEMVADWIGASETYGTPMKKWLSTNLNIFYFHPETRKTLRSILSKLGTQTDEINGRIYVVN